MPVCIKQYTFMHVFFATYVAFTCASFEMDVIVYVLYISLWYINYPRLCVGMVTCTLIYLQSYIPLQINTYQGIVITNGTKSFAVFIYNCELLNPRSVAGIGYYFSSTLFEEHPLSNTNRSSTIACENPHSPWNSVIFGVL